jgi:hypothetical protein
MVANQRFQDTRGEMMLSKSNWCRHEGLTMRNMHSLAPLEHG